MNIPLTPISWILPPTTPCPSHTFLSAIQMRLRKVIKGHGWLVVLLQFFFCSFLFFSLPSLGSLFLLRGDIRSQNWQSCYALRCGLKVWLILFTWKSWSLTMGVGGGLSCIKYLMFGFNFLFWVSIYLPFMLANGCSLFKPVMYINILGLAK